GELEAVRVALLSGEGAELAAQDAGVGVIDVAIDDVAGAVAGLALAREVGDGADGIEVPALEEAQGVGFGDAFAGGDLFMEVPEFAALRKKVHRPKKITRGNTTSATVTIKNTMLMRALSRKKARSIHFRLRRRASQCSSSRLPSITSSPTKYATRKPQSNPKAKSSPHMTMCARNAAARALRGPQRTTSECSPCWRSKS